MDGPLNDKTPAMCPRSQKPAFQGDFSDKSVDDIFDEVEKE